eukprot:XP_019927335.1 PREDICTED: uncharacterized protein LOC105339185 isoform X2 [Crassostrea gigas]
MGFLLHDDRKNSGEEGYMAAGLGKTEVIALGSILGVFAFLVSLGVAAYCYRMYDIFKRTKRGSSNESGRKLVYVQQEKPSKAEKTPASNKSLRKILKTSMPPPKPILRNPLVIPQKSMPSRNHRSPREVQIHNSYPGGVRVIRLNQDHAKPMLVYRPGPPRPTYTQSHLPNTVPHLRLGDYRPKMVSGYFSPNNVRSMMDDFPVNSDTSFNSSGSRFTWVPAKPEKVNHQARHYQLDCICDVNFIQLDEKGTQTKPAKERRKVTRNSATSTSGHKFPDPTTVKTIKQNSDLTSQITQYIETGSKFVIIDYIASDNQKSGELPLSTSTPRDYQGLTTDTNHNFVPRQRKPHDGSLVEIPAS